MGAATHIGRVGGLAVAAADDTTQTSSEASTTPKATEQNKSTTQSGTTTNTVKGDVVVSAQTNTGTRPSDTTSRTAVTRTSSNRHS
jgi:hypothetical protein